MGRPYSAALALASEQGPEVVALQAQSQGPMLKAEGRSTNGGRSPLLFP